MYIYMDDVLSEINFIYQYQLYCFEKDTIIIQFSCTVCESIVLRKIVAKTGC